MINRITCQKTSGFTLLEVLVVMLLIGILATTAIISYSPPSFQQIREKLNALVDQIGIAQERALLESIPLGIVFFQQKYIFVTIQNRTWIKYSEFPEVEIDLYDANLVIDNVAITLPDSEITSRIFPQVVFNPSSEMTAFELTLNLYNEDTSETAIFEVTTDILGRAKLVEYKNQ